MFFTLFSENRVVSCLLNLIANNVPSVRQLLSCTRSPTISVIISSIANSTRPLDDSVFVWEFLQKVASTVSFSLTQNFYDVIFCVTTYSVFATFG